MQPIISIKNITKHYPMEGDKTLAVLENITLEILPGEFFMVVGPSGCGKSTLLRIMSGLEKNYEGALSLDSSIMQSDINFVFQEFALLPWLTVAENVGLGLRARRMKREDREARVRREIEGLGLSGFASSYPRELSGGMKQRVGIARALATDPKIIFMDEPFSELDTFTAEELRNELLGIWRERKTTILMVTHIIEEAVELADRIAVMTPRPGRIEKVVENNLTRPREERSEPFYRLEDYLYALIKP